MNTGGWVKNCGDRLPIADQHGSGITKEIVIVIFAGHAIVE